MHTAQVVLLRLLVSRCITLQKLHRSVLSRYTELAADSMKRKRPATPTEQPVVKQLRLQHAGSCHAAERRPPRRGVHHRGSAALRDGGAASDSGAANGCKPSCQACSLAGRSCVGRQ